MAVMDFREGGYVFSRHKVRREFSYDQDWDQADGQGDEQRFAADPDGVAPLTTRLARLTHYLGAVASVGLMVGLLVWGFQLVSRDVSGVPVIAAIEGEARTTPDDPGGELTSYTGYAVNDVAAGSEPAPVDRVAIAPSATGLDDSDVAMGELGATAREPATEVEAPLNFDGEAITPLSDSEAKAQAEALAAAEAERLRVQQEVQQAAIVDAPATEGPVNEVVTDENGAPAQAAAIAAALAEAQAIPQGAVSSSARPAPRPRTTRVVAAAATAPKPVQAAAEPTPAPAPSPAASSVSVSSGAPLVQVGAFDSEAIANSEWSRLSGKFGSLFSGKGPVVQRHQSNGRTFWRLRVAGFDARSDAQSFCSALKAGGTDCIAIAAP